MAGRDAGLPAEGPYVGERRTRELAVAVKRPNVLPAIKERKDTRVGVLAREDHRSEGDDFATRCEALSRVGNGSGVGCLVDLGLIRFNLGLLDPLEVLVAETNTSGPAAAVGYPKGPEVELGVELTSRMRPDTPD